MYILRNMHSAIYVYYFESSLGGTCPPCSYTCIFKLPSTGPFPRSKGHNNLQHGTTPTVCQDAKDYDEVDVVPPHYSSPHNTDAKVNSTSNDTSSSYQHLVMPLNPEHTYAVVKDTCSVLENEKGGSDGCRLASDPKREVKESGRTSDDKET